MWKFLCGHFEPDNISQCWRLIIPLLLQKTLIKGEACQQNLSLQCHLCCLLLFFSSEFSLVTAGKSQIVGREDNSKAFNYYNMLLVYNYIIVLH